MPDRPNSSPCFTSPVLDAYASYILAGYLNDVLEILHRIVQGDG
jgi:hypothetical protein